MTIKSGFGFGERRESLDSVWIPPFCLGNVPVAMVPRIVCPFTESLMPDESSVHLIVHGAAGRMGRRVVALAVEDPAIRLVAAIDRPESPAIGQDIAVLAGLAPCDISLAGDWPAADAETATASASTAGRCVIDFSLPEAVDACVANCVRRGLPLVVATTGLEAHQHEALRQAAATIPICWAPSMSLAVNLTMRLTQQITAALKDVTGGVDIEILERHHRFKEDAPSGTALKFGELIAEQLAPKGPVRHVHGREGKTGRRTAQEIGYHAIRVGDNPGEHTIVFGMLGERIELTVAASNRDCYASGAIAAAKWLQSRPAGLYDMFDVLGMKPR